MEMHSEEAPNVFGGEETMREAPKKPTTEFPEIDITDEVEVVDENAPEAEDMSKAA